MIVVEHDQAFKQTLATRVLTLETNASLFNTDPSCYVAFLFAVSTKHRKLRMLNKINTRSLYLLGERRKYPFEKVTSLFYSKI